jgi:single-strand DNA-binding protein
MNKIEIIGFVGQVHPTRQAGKTSVTSFSVATNEGYKNKAGQWVDKSAWHDLEIWGDLPHAVTKGHKVLVVGKLTYSEYTDKATNKPVKRAVVRASTVEQLVHEKRA